MEEALAWYQAWQQDPSQRSEFDPEYLGEFAHRGDLDKVSQIVEAFPDLNPGEAAGAAAPARSHSSGEVPSRSRSRSRPCH